MIVDEKKKIIEKKEKKRRLSCVVSYVNLWIEKEWESQRVRLIKSDTLTDIELSHQIIR
jgi:hypothetical protein